MSGTDIRIKLKSEPDIFLRLTENSMLVAASLRDKFLDQTIDIASKIRKRLEIGSLKSFRIKKISPDHKTGSNKITVAFIDVGVGEAEIFLKVPLIVRGGIFRIRKAKET